MRLFLSHASEDKDFVRPLAEALRPHFQVWFDESELVMGDSLLKKIDEGLKSCDYGVVVLSPHFFAKKWTRAELDGLFVKEDKVRKVILPVWKDVSEEDVRQYSPILAGRLGVPADSGIQSVVAAIQRAIQVGNRVAEFTAVKAATERLRNLDQTISRQQLTFELLHTTKGAPLLRAEFDRLFITLERELLSFPVKTRGLAFTLKRTEEPVPMLAIETGTRVLCVIRLMNVGTTDAANALVSVRLVRRIPQPLEQSPVIEPIREIGFHPTFRAPQEVIWKGDKEITTEELAGRVIEEIVQALRREF